MSDTKAPTPQSAIEVQREVDLDGLRVHVVSLPHLRTATLSLFVGVGSRHETATNNGISHLLEHMLFRGTERYPTSYALHTAIESLGGVLDGGTHPDFTEYSLTVPARNLGPAILRFGEVFEMPTFPQLDVEREVLLEELREDLDEDDKLISPDDLLRMQLFSEHPLGLPVGGRVENLECLDEAALRAWFTRHYVRQNAVLVIAGSFAHHGIDDALRGVRDSFEHLPVGTASRAEPFRRHRARPTSRFQFVTDEGSQTQVRLAFHGPGLAHPDQMGMQLLSRILDDGLSARVFRRITEETGLAYDCYSALEAFAECGVLDFGASVGHAKVPALLEAFHALTGELRDAAVPGHELEKARQRFLWDLDMMMDDDAAVAEFVGTNALFRIPDTLESTIAEANAVTASDLQRIARDVFAPGTEVVTCVGELATDEAALRRAALRGSP